MKKITFITIASLFVFIKSFAQTVTIGKQVWMSENLNVDKFRNGDLIPQAITDAEWEAAGNSRQPAWCYYVNDAKNGEKYGKLYNWYAVNDSRGLAPKGWHIPSDAEWTTLTNYLGGEEKAGAKMKSKSGWSKEGNGTNSSGFSDFPGGYRLYNGIFKGVGDGGSWLSSTEFDTLNVWSRTLSSSSGKVWRSFDFFKGDGLSVRCLSD
jgi:uncharacterized protein (TIGR02145 family)